MRSSGEGRRTKARRLAIGALGAIGLLFVLYLVVANVLLMTAAGPSLASSERSRVTWRSGWSIVPSRVHLRELAVDVRGKRTSWRIESERVDLAVSPFALLAGRIDASSAELDEVTVQGRDLPPEGPSPAPPAAKPGAAAPIALVTAIDAPADEAPSLRVDRLTAAHVRRVELADVAYVGDATVRGELRAWESGPVDMAHAAIDLPSGEVSLFGQRFLEDLRGHLTIERSRVDTNAPAREAWFSARDGGLELDAAVTGAHVLARTEARVPGAAGTFRASLRIADGALAPHSTAALRVPAVAPPDGRAPFSADVVFGVAEAGDATLTAVLHEIAWPPASAAPPRATMAGLHVEVRSPRVALAAPADGASGTLDATGVSLDLASVPLFSSLLRGPAPARGDAHLEVDRGTARGPIAMRADDAEIALGAASVRGPLVVSGELRGWKLGGDEAVVVGTAKQSRAGDDGGAVATLRLDEARLGLGEAASLDGPCALHLSDAKLALDALLGEKRLPVIAGAIAAAAPVDVTATVHADAARTELRDVRGSVGIVSVEGSFVQPAEGPRQGTFLLELGPIATGVDIEGREATFILADAKAWFDDRASKNR